MATNKKYRIVRGIPHSAVMDSAVGVYDSYEQAVEALPNDLEPNVDTDPEMGGERWYPLGTSQNEMDRDHEGFWAVAKIVAEDEQEGV